MNCHEDNKEKKGAHNHSPLKHILHMVICCGLPIIIVAFLPLISRLSPGAAGVVSRIVPFLCPIMMVGMMVTMMGGSGSKKKSCCENTSEENDTKKIDAKEIV